VSPYFVRRAVWLVGICFVAVLAAVVISQRRGHTSEETLPGAVTVPGSGNGYYTGRAAPYSPTGAHARTACGQAFTDSTQGVAHPVLPCGVRIYIRFHGQEVLTQVIDRGPTVPGRDFGITKALANRLGLHGPQTIEWRFAK
jgi:rare lipoprotein A (peptidoglycan hydrolase)